mmetsp:Transcript_946/g.2260  ORF Transcript_946/g.2260 Transcript_946/m.2260 type:complete len:1135 (-) Transcript_946:63-3467(-)
MRPKMTHSTVVAGRRKKIIQKSSFNLQPAILGAIILTGCVCYPFFLLSSLPLARGDEVNEWDSQTTRTSTNNNINGIGEDSNQQPKVNPVGPAPSSTYSPEPKNVNHPLPTVEIMQPENPEGKLVTRSTRPSKTPAYPPITSANGLQGEGITESITAEIDNAVTEEISHSPTYANNDGNGETDNEPTHQPSPSDANEIHHQSSFIENDPQLLHRAEAESLPLRSFQSIFAPHQEEYDLLRFDPHSFSGAPLGGWGRATRSRLASLPLRLVSDFGGGMELLYHDEDDSDDGLAEGSEEDQSRKAEEELEPINDLGTDDDIIGEMEISTDGSQVPLNAGSSTGATSSPQKSRSPPSTVQTSTSKPPRRSKGPHFTIHDGTGQKYICRVYPEEELVVTSRVDSMFVPAVAVWDKDALDSKAKGAGAVSKTTPVDDTNINTKSSMVNTPIVDVNGEPLPDAIRSGIYEVLSKLGLGDLGFEIADAVVAGIEEDFGNFEDNAVDAAEIAMAAAVGAGMDGAMQLATSRENDVDDAEDGDSSPHVSQEQVMKALADLKGICSQLHLGWWSYEWCHEEHVRQFHVAISEDPSLPGYGPKYEVQDVIMVGMHLGETQIIYPKHTYKGEEKGRTITMKSGLGQHRSSWQYHTAEEDEKYSRAHQAAASSSKSQGSIFHQYKQELGHGGPIIKQTFDQGDTCEEVGRQRHMSVELRCCTEDEIDHWLESKKQRAKGYSTQRGAGHRHEEELEQKKQTDRHPGSHDTPLAVLVSVQEDKEEICTYRSRVCTPLLCPKPRNPKQTMNTDYSKKVSSKAHRHKAKAAESTTTKKQDGITTLMNSIFGGGMDVDDNGEIRVIMADRETAEAFEQLIQQSENGVDIVNTPQFEKVKKLLNVSPNQNIMKNMVKKFSIGSDAGEDSIKSSIRTRMVEVKEGESIRSILMRTLLSRSCLVKNIGWWSYEFCHMDRIRQYHAANLVDASTGMMKQRIESEHLLGLYSGSGNDVEDYPDDEEHLYVINATSSNIDLSIGGRNPKAILENLNKQHNDQGPGGNGAVYIQEYFHGDVCDHEDVAESVIKGGNIVHGSVERSSTVRFSCGKTWDIVNIKEDKTCHYVLDVTVPELCEHPLFKAAVTQTQVVKCLPL